MPRDFLGGEAKQALLDAARTIEQSSAVEVVVSVRPRSGSYLGAHLAVGAVFALAALAFMLFAPPPFALVWFLVDPVVVGAIAALASSRLPYARRWLTTRSGRQTRVRLAAEAVFYERGIHHTARRTGLLVYISLLERSIVLLADSGIDAAIPRREWETARAQLQRTMDRAASGKDIADALSELSEVFAHHLPRPHDDDNELADEVDA